MKRIQIYLKILFVILILGFVSYQSLHDYKSELEEANEKKLFLSLKPIDIYDITLKKTNSYSYYADANLIKMKISNDNDKLKFITMLKNSELKKHNHGWEYNQILAIVSTKIGEYRFIIGKYNDGYTDNPTNYNHAVITSEKFSKYEFHSKDMYLCMKDLGCF